MVTATISEVRNGLSAYLRRVEAGETVLIVNRKLPVARIVPLGHTSAGPDEQDVDDDQARIQRLVASGAATRRSARSVQDVFKELGGEWPAGKGLLNTLLAERDAEYREGRR